MAWSEAARAAAAEARRRKAGNKGVYDTGTKFRDNEGGGPYHLVERRKDLLKRIAHAKGTIKGRVPLHTKTITKEGNTAHSGGAYGSKGAATRDLRKMRGQLYGNALPKGISSRKGGSAYEKRMKKSGVKIDLFSK